MDSTEYSKTCFVIMPFGEREIDGKKYHFDEIYNNVFLTAISMVDLPEGGKLIAKRADAPNTAGIITDEMFRDILYSRVVLADITGLNPNVFYELGIRHSLRPRPTVVIKERQSNIPFDVHNLRIFSYDIDGVSGFGKALSTIRNCLSESIRAKNPDSPVYSTLKGDLEWPDFDLNFTEKYKIESWFERQKVDETVEEYMNEAKRSLALDEIDSAIASCKGAIELKPDSLHINMQLGLLYKEVEEFKEAEKIFKKVIETHPMYSVGWRELGVVEHKLKKATDAVKSLEKALDINPSDSDAWCSYAGVQKTLSQYTKAQEGYEEGLKKNPRSTYALLNYLTMYTLNNQKLPAINELKDEFSHAVKKCEANIKNRINIPWSLFDLAQIEFFKGNINEAKDLFSKGVKNSTASWQVSTAKNTYELLNKSGLNISHLTDLISSINDIETDFKRV